MIGGTSLTEEIPETLRNEIKHIINVDFDKAMNDILAYIILHEPVSLYKITRDTPYGISSVYKKAKRMINDGLIKSSLNHNISDKRCRNLYEATVKGILTCMAYKCLDDEVLLNKLRIKWQLKTFCSQRIVSILKLLPQIIKISNDSEVIENPRALMVLILTFASDHAHTKNLEMNQVIRDAYAAALYYIINRLILDKSLNDEVIIGHKDFLIGMDSNRGRVIIYSCKLCNKNCFLIDGNNGCNILREARRKITEILML
ncbi:hypothetical protein [Vulcanisaeta thermophila]|uniref:hypothetical protein n=1 Tax=Vulcanisaeta thermophila TaxID=867917 RepID=UPI000A001FBC|nr:hypothetical protein [Vulcanisaeta thermophila]